MAISLKFLSVCSGIEAASVAFRPLGWQPVGFSEIEPFPCAVLEHHYPEVPNYGDLTQQESWKLPAFDVLCGGTPCQGFSVAGKRGGLADARSQLVWHFLEIARRERPRWVLWENVPGVLSSEGGADFGAVLGRLGECGYGFAYRVLDAQYFGVAQRRRRVFVVGYLGDWRPAAAVLFERESMSGNPPPRRETGKSSAHPVSPCIGGRGFGRTGETRGQDPVVAHALKADGFDASEDGTGRGCPLVAAPLSAGSFDTSHTPGRRREDDYNLVPECSPALKQRDFKGPSSDGDGDGAPLIPVAVRTAQTSANGHGIAENVAHTIDQAQGQAIAFQSKASAHQSMNPSEISPALDIGKSDGVSVVAAMAVRRLTPRECERLQGFPDDRKTVILRVCRNEDERQELARTAEGSSPAQEPGSSRPVAVRVLIDLERHTVQLHSLGRSPLFVSSAADENWSRLRIPQGDFVRLGALMTSSLVPATGGGRVESLLSIRRSSRQFDGSVFVHLSGSEINALANDVERFTSALRQCTQSITSEAGRNIPNYEQSLRTLCCCVAAAIGSFIPEPIRKESSFDLELETVLGYTLVPYRNKPAADGPRYKALGNSWAVPCARYIGERINLVNGLIA